ncbi:MerR family transcriptional regulator [Georgenia sp. Z1491]|uniref:MerR family transcriptional regulator n=1 Tax=Georgenia sp. Z1491 TaxID=3416707 RepID=UPI003CE76853
MRISELAELAGVTVRAVRYYHQMGALEEPPRGSNGYRDYTADHLVALLRISQLTSSGLSLAQAGVLAAEPGSSSTEEELDEAARARACQVVCVRGPGQRWGLIRSG